MTTSPAPPTSDTPAHFRPVQAPSVPNSTLEPEEMCEAQDDVLHKKTEVSLDMDISFPSLSEHLNVTDVLQHMLSLEAWKELLTLFHLQPIGTTITLLPSNCQDFLSKW